MMRDTNTITAELATEKRGQYAYVRVLCFEKPFQVADARKHRRESLQYLCGWQIMVLPTCFRHGPLRYFLGRVRGLPFQVSR